MYASRVERKTVIIAFISIHSYGSSFCFNTPYTHVQLYHNLSDQSINTACKYLSLVHLSVFIYLIQRMCTDRLFAC